MNEFVKLDINREKKRLKVASSKTNYRFMQTKYHNLFDKGKEQLQEKLTDRLDDEQFKQAIIAQMAQYGYKLVKGD